MRPAMVLVPPASWAAIKSYIIKMCKKHDDCSDNIGKWERKMVVLDTKGKK
jgi:hypothetical protein